MSSEVHFTTSWYFAAPLPSPSITTAPNNQPKVNVSNEYVFVRQWGNVPGKSIAIETNMTHNVYIADNVNDRIQKFDSNGNFITKWESKSLKGIVGLVAIALDSSGKVYVADESTNTIQVMLHLLTLLNNHGP
jgi:DNA-binding beta-propeller fold protein YncE